MQRLLKSALAGLAAVCLVAPGAQAADIGWTVGPTFGGASGYGGILTNGTLVAAIDVGSGAATRTVDPGGLNLTFTVVNPAYLTAYIFGSGSPGSGDPGWDAVVNDADWNGGDLSVPSFLSDLTPGATYQLQLFASDLRSCCSARQSRFGDGNGHFSSFVVQGSMTSIVGTFTATAATQAIEFDTTSNAPILNAYVLREVAAVPEPGTWALSLGGLALLAGLRRRAA